MKKYNVIVGGSVSMDRIIKVNNSLKLGFTSMIENKNNSNIYYGGCSLNVAYLMAKLGMSVLPYIRVGEDYDNIGFHDFLKTESNLSLEAIEIVKGEVTSNSYMIETPEKEHFTIYYPGAMNGKYFRPMNPEFFKSSEMGVITVGSIEDNSEFFSQCKNAGLPVVLGMRTAFGTFPKELFWEILSYSKIIFANNDEREVIEETFNLGSVTELFKKTNAQIIVTTLGSSGSLCYMKNEEGYETNKIPVAKCKNIVDTTGSGDAYIAGFLYGYFKGFESIECCYLGGVLSSFVIEKEGCLSNAPSEKDFLVRYKEYLEERKGQ